jgi:hypothetical protein
MGETHKGENVIDNAQVGRIGPGNYIPDEDKRCDPIARLTFQIHSLITRGLILVHLGDDFAVDLTTRYGPPYLTFDTEVKHSWDEDFFPFPTVDVPVRKQKYIKPGFSVVMFNDSLEYFTMIPGEVLLKAKREPKDTYRSVDELFFKVPTNEVTIERAITRWRELPY